MQNGTQTTQTQTAQAPSWQLPYLQYGLNQAQGNYQNISSPTQLVAPFSDQQNQAIQGITDLATNNPTLGSASGYVQSVLSGSPASNPYLDSMFNQGANAVQNRLESEFAGSGRNVIGSLPVQSDELNNLAAQLYGGAYNTGVQQQENALASAPNVVGSQLGLQSGLFGAGQNVQNLAQQYITAPQNFLNNYLSQVTGNLGRTVTTQEPYSPALQTAQYAGLGSQLGSGIASALGGNSTWQNVGGLLGALGGAFA